MRRKISVKITLNPSDPFDSEIVQALEKEKNRAGFIRKAVFCYIRGLGVTQPARPIPPPERTEKDKLLDTKLSKLVEL